MRVVAGLEVGESSLEDVALDRDQVQDDLACRPFARRGVAAPLGGTGGPFDPSPARREQADQLGTSQRRTGTHESRP
ncbi:MAG: hypothetical protein ACXWWU_02090, partial [Candidatus Limnocylindria bacterium]